jgi:hypothetical protein
MGFGKGLLISLLLISIVTVTFSTLLLDTGTEYGLSIDGEYNRSFSNYEKTRQEYIQKQEIVEGGAINPEGQDNAVYTNAIVTAKQMQSTGNLFSDFVTGTSVWLGIDPFIISVATVVVFALLTFAILGVLLKVMI